MLGPTNGDFFWESSWYVVSEEKQCLVTYFVPLLLDDGRTSHRIRYLLKCTSKLQLSIPFSETVLSSLRSIRNPYMMFLIKYSHHIGVMSTWCMNSIHCVLQMFQ